MHDLGKFLSKKAEILEIENMLISKLNQAKSTRGLNTQSRKGIIDKSGQKDSINISTKYC